VTDNIFTGNPLSKVSGLTIFGAGNELSIIKFNITDNTKICLNLFNVWHGLFRDFQILGVNNIGTGIQLGDPTTHDTNHTTYNCDFENVYCKSLNIGVDGEYCWGNSFNNLKTRYCNTGTIISGQNTFTNFNAEANNTIGIKVFANEASAILSFNGALIENNPIGMVIDGGNVVLNNPYFESNTTANIQAGINSTTVDSVCINGLFNGDYHNFIFDKVTLLKITGVTGYMFYNQFQISANVKLLSMDEGSQMISNSNATHMQTINATTKKVQPLIANDLQNITTFANPLALDFTGAVTVKPALTTGSLATFNGKNVVKYVATNGSFNGMYMILDFTNRYLKSYKKLKVKTRLYIDATTFQSVSNSRLDTKVRINYTNTSSAASYKDFYDTNPSDSNNNLYQIRNNHISHFISLDINSMIAQIPDFSSITNIYLYYYPVVTAVGGETFYFEGFEMYPATEVKDILIDSVNVPPFGQPVLVSPGGLKFALSVSDAGALTATQVTY
jgi:hypothetical protein